MVMTGIGIGRGVGVASKVLGFRCHSSAHSYGLAPILINLKPSRAHYEVSSHVLEPRGVHALTGANMTCSPFLP